MGKQDCQSLSVVMVSKEFSALKWVCFYFTPFLMSEEQNMGRIEFTF